MKQLSEQCSLKTRKNILRNCEKQMKTFCSCMYRAFLYPHKCYEITEKGETVHYAPSSGKILPGVRYTDNGFWDTYRTCYPFYALVAKDEYREMCRAFVNDYLELIEIQTPHLKLSNLTIGDKFLINSKLVAWSK